MSHTNIPGIRLKAARQGLLATLVAGVLAGCASLHGSEACGLRTYTAVEPMVLSCQSARPISYRLWTGGEDAFEDASSPVIKGHLGRCQGDCPIELDSSMVAGDAPVVTVEF